MTGGANATGAMGPGQGAAPGLGGADPGSSTGGVAGDPRTASPCNLPAPSATGIAAPSGAPGALTVVSWAGFKGAVSYTFDDANSSQIAHYPELQALGVPVTFYLQTGKSEASDETWTQALVDGHELGNHTVTHPETASAEDVDDATAFIVEHFGVTPYTMAAPYGNSSYIEVAETRFLINRGVAGGSVAPNSSVDPFNLPCHIPAEGAKASAMDTVIDSAHSAGKWQLVLIHGFTGGSDGAYKPVDFAEFSAHVIHAKSLPDLWIDSVVEVGAYWRAEKLLGSLTPTTSGSETTWTWTLPDHFPPGKCLRVRVDGGTLSQGGTPLSWDDHGYYEIALDAGALTLTP